MKRVLFMRLVVSLFASVWAVSASAENSNRVSEAYASVSNRPYRVLFIGHSLFFVNSVPEAVEYLSQAAKVTRPLQATICTKGGATHQVHWDSPDVMQHLHDEEWDLVLIAGNLNDMHNPEKVNLEYAIKLDNEAKRKCGRVMEYLAWPWGLEHETGEKTQVFERRMNAQKAFDKNLLLLARETGVTLVPCGPGLVNVIKKDLKFMDEMKYGDVHVSAVGSYFTACVIFAEIYNQSPEGLPSIFQKYKIDQARASVLQRTAWETVQEWKKIQAAGQ